MSNWKGTAAISPGQRPGGPAEGYIPLDGRVEWCLPAVTKEVGMGEHRTSMIERIVSRIEEHIEDWRKRDAARAAEAEANRDELWAAAAERERLLAEVIGEEEAHHASAEEVMKEHR